MTFKEKKDYLFHNHYNEWVKKFREEENNLSDSFNIVCVCGKLATGLHLMHCTKFRDKVERNTVKSLGHLIPKKNDKKQSEQPT